VNESRTEWTVDELIGDLRRMGIGQGDLVMVHASLRAIGPVDGGADGLLDALSATIGPDGTILMTLGARDDWGWVNERPERERAELLDGSPPFDASTTPADPDVGVLAEVFRTRPGTVVSDHPEGRFGASGAFADRLVADVPWDHYYGPGSPLERLVDAGGTILRLGADLDTLTVLHHAEYLVELPRKRQVRRHRVVTGPDGPDVRTIECLDDSDGIVDHPDGDYFPMILTEYLGAGRALAAGRVGAATSELIDAADVVAFGVDWMSRHLVDHLMKSSSSGEQLGVSNQS
jgi:aminoglycoside N3'-acetyltransferase